MSKLAGAKVMRINPNPQFDDVKSDIDNLRWDLNEAQTQGIIDKDIFVLGTFQPGQGRDGVVECLCLVEGKSSYDHCDLYGIRRMTASYNAVSYVSDLFSFPNLLEPENRMKYLEGDYNVWTLNQELLIDPSSNEGAKALLVKE